MGRSISRKIGITAVMSLFVCLLAATSFAQPEGKGPGGPGGPGGGNFMQRFDANGDGKVDLDEFSGPFDQFDANQDGFITDDEAPTGPPSGGKGKGKGPGGPDGKGQDGPLES